MDMMRTAGQAGQYGACIGEVYGLPKQSAVEINHRVAAEHEGSRPRRRHGSSFSRAKSDLLDRRQPRCGMLMKFRRIHLEGRSTVPEVLRRGNSTPTLAARETSTLGSSADSAPVDQLLFGPILKICEKGMEFFDGRDPHHLCAKRGGMWKAFTIPA